MRTLPVVSLPTVSFLWNVWSQLRFKNLNIYVCHLCPGVTLSVNLVPDLWIKSWTIYWNGFQRNPLLEISGLDLREVIESKTIISLEQSELTEMTKDLSRLCKD